MTISTEQQNNTAPLSRRQIQIVELLATGISNQEIADHLQLSSMTVKSHLANITQRMGNPGDRAGIVGAAYRQGIIQLPFVARLIAENKRLRLLHATASAPDSDTLAGPTLGTVDLVAVDRVRAGIPTELTEEDLAYLYPKLTCGNAEMRRVAGALGVSEKTIERRIARARKKSAE